MGSTFFAHGFRPFFLGAALWAAGAVVFWIIAFASGTAIPSRFDPVNWHIHEMLFGFAMAAIAGFLLTAIPNWTRRLPVSGGPLALLVALWLLGRAACFASAAMPAWIAMTADLSFPVVLVAVVAREIVAGRNWRNLPMIGPVAVLGLANLLMHLESDGIAVPAGLGWRLALAAVLVLISVVGGRIIPSFTHNWLAKQGDHSVSSVPGPFDRAALIVLAGGLLVWSFSPHGPYSGWLLILGAALHLWRLAGWKGLATTAEPLLLILHVGYGWLVLGVGLLGLAILLEGIPESAALHALTAGAIGTMVLAVMTRVSRGHTGRALTADRTTCVIYILVNLAAVLRVSAAFSGDWAMILLEGSAGLWAAAFCLFALAYGPMLVRPRLAP